MNVRRQTLAYLVRNDGGTPGEIADALFPAPRFGPVSDGMSFAEREEARAEHRRRARRTVQNALRKLTQLGRVESVGPVMLEGWAFEASAQHDLAAVMRHVYDRGLVESFNGDADPDEAGGTESPTPERTQCRRIVQALGAGPLSRSGLAYAVTNRRKGSGAFDRALARLAERGIVVLPSLRRPTDNGRAWLAGRTDV